MHELSCLVQKVTEKERVFSCTFRNTDDMSEPADGEILLRRKYLLF